MTTVPTDRVQAQDTDMFLLGGRAEDPALVTPTETLTYGRLAGLVRARAAQLGATRRLVLLEARNDVATVVTYLAAWAARHPVLVVGAEESHRQGDVVRTYRPGPGHDLHPDLAVLLSTSGSTGSPKLVRLSRDNVEANARSIAMYLGLGPRDRAITSLPLHYCYGLSVLTSHLVSGASVVLTDLSVADECFWDLFRSTGSTSVAGVPYTFDLLEASNFSGRDLPTLRYLTQAGGRMPPDQVRRFAELGRSRGWDLFVMYGQTEATARIAYLPPSLAVERPSSIGIPVPGGELRIEPLPDADGLPADVGELVYTGPNVMMGYAENAADLARGHETDELRTGDLARQADDGLFEVVGRRNRCVKVFGLRVDLDRVERQLGAEGREARLVAHEDQVHAFVTRPRLTSPVRDLLSRLTSLPPGAVRVHTVAALPRTDAGKCDYAALRSHAAASATTPEAPATSVRDLYAVALGRPDVRGGDTFTSLGGDSLSFVEVSTRLADHLGHLPADWPHRTIDELTKAPLRPRRFTTPVEMGVLLRATAIVMVVVTHTDLWLVPGGAHLLLALAGYNLARFTLRTRGRRQRCRRVIGALAAVVVPASAWIAGCAVATGDYRMSTALYLNGVVGAQTWTPDWQFWFLEALVWVHLGLAALLVSRRVDGWQRAHPFPTAMVVVGAALLVRYLLVGLQAEDTQKYSVAVVLWVVALGWAAAEAASHRQRTLVGLTALAGTVGFFGDAQRELVVVVGVLLLLWAGPVAVPRRLARLTQLVASASLWIYLTHWQVYPWLEAAGHAPAAVLASLAVGVACSTGYLRCEQRLKRRRAPRRGPRSATPPRAVARPRPAPLRPGPG